MILDYVAGTGYFVVRVPRADHQTVSKLLKEYGFDLSLTASNTSEAVLMTAEPYAAVALAQHATPRAAEQLAPIVNAIEKSWARESDARIKCPSDKELWPYQRAGVAYALDRPNTLIADQPGLGKTAQAICIANEMQAQRVLVVVPAAVRLQWVKSIREWTTMRWPYSIHAILNTKHGVHPTANWLVVSYEGARNPAIGKALAKGKYDLLILDEAHYLKTIDARRTRAVFGGGENREFEALASRCSRIVALTGTPTPNRPREAYTLARGLCFDAIDWLSEDRFTGRFNPSLRKEILDPKTGRMRYVTDERSAREHELNARLRGNFMVRREKRGPNGVLNQLKYPVYDIVQLEETGAVRQALKAESMLGIDPENLEGADAAIIGQISQVRLQMGLALAPQVADYVATLLDSGEEKVALFGWHIEVMRILAERLGGYGVAAVTGLGHKAQKVEAFMTDPNCRVIMGNILTMGVGTDGLQEVCTRVVIAEPSWTPGDNQQAVDRLDRFGQKGTVLADFMVAPNSFAERILATALRKLRTINTVLDVRHA